MLTTEQRQTLIDYLSTKGSDTVLMEAFESARREYEHATMTICNFELEKAKAKASKKERESSVPPPPAPATNTEVIIKLLSDEALPTKFAALGREIVDTLKRKGAPMNLADIAKAVRRSTSHITPPLALAVKRGLVIQLRTDLFEVKP